MQHDKLIDKVGENMRPELRFLEFDNDWEKDKLSNLGDFTSGGTPLKSNSEYWNGDIPWITTGDIADLRKEKISNFITEKGLKESSAKLIKNKAIIIAMYGQGKTRGMSAILNFNATTNQACAIFQTEFDINFVYQFFQKSYKDIRSLSNEGSQKNLSLSLLKDIYLNYPCKAEQQKIGDFFSKLDRQIELEEQKLAKLEEQKKGYMQKIFSQQLGFKDENGNEYPTWQSYKLGNLYKKGKAGGTPKSTESKYYNGEVPFLSISDITEQGKFIMNTEKSITQEGVDNSTAWLVPVNSINYAMYASVGYLSINKIEVATSQAIFNMVFEDNNLVEYIYYYLNHIRDKGILEKLVGTGTQSNLSASIMKSMYIKLPDYEEMVKITDFLSKVDKLIEKQNQKIDGLKERKKGFLQKMFV